MGAPASLLVADGLCVYTVPKVASCSLHDAMVHASQHEPTLDFDGYKFMVVRHPLGRLVSYWNFKNKTRKDRDKISFYEFWETTRELYRQDHHTIPQVDYTGGKTMDCLVKMENLNVEWPKLKAMFPTIGDIKVLNASNPGVWHMYYSPDSRREAEEIYADDIELYRMAI